MSGRLQLYDKTQIEKNNLLFDNKALAALLFPLIIEQLLNSFMGMADTMMVSNVGSAAISAVSLVDSVNMLVIQVFSALATGAAIICSQYIGSRNIKECNNAARQVVLSVAVISVSLMIIGIIFRYPLLRLIFGNVEADVMDNSLVYFLITVCSYPFLALFNVGAAFFRADGNARYPMTISVISNIINIIGNAILIFGLSMGVAGAAISTLISRIFCMVVVFCSLRKPKQTIVINDILKIRPDMKLIKRVLSIGIPAGIENRDVSVWKACDTVNGVFYGDSGNCGTGYD